MTMQVTEAEAQLLLKLRALSASQPDHYSALLDAVYQYAVTPPPAPAPLPRAVEIVYCFTSCGCDGRWPAIECTSSLGSCARCMFTTGRTRGQDPT
jgi:hypothetical protein